ncbi:amidohydrolase [Actinokineospora auranticolor]|uniref:Hippurate hydrolase n=1 Tax=Actinokineospora auranticolor TaxID=155976 RepID=A0A2S6GET5_9PSEU|nr:amidohydrolase [Actinokineospora auranticolor]PPK63733.1 hippurate hydrolase [Actinokineospora auranticolor]
MSDLLARAPSVVREALVLYLGLHREPELSGAEVATAAALARWLRADGFEVTTGVGGHGVVGVLRNGPGRRVLVRAELDALPVRERTGLAYASDVVSTTPDGVRTPVAHACGHDFHLAAVAGAARVLAAATDRWRGTLVVVGQPEEETLRGAAAMLADGLYQRFGVPDAVLAQHCAPLPAAVVAHAADGPALAAGVVLRVVLRGPGGHAATARVDPVGALAALATRLRVEAVSPTGETAMVTVGALLAGVSVNVVPEEVTLSVMARAFAEDALDGVIAAVRRIVAEECTESVRGAVEVVARTPVTESVGPTARWVRAAHTAEFGAARVAAWPPATACEDFALFGPAGTDLHGGRGIDLVHWMVGVVGPRRWAATPGVGAAAKLAALEPNHSPRFAPDVGAALGPAVTAMATAALAGFNTVSPPVGHLQYGSS